ncbi:hypothetical protein [Enterococcus columbae]|uniref:Uncharacterized protein n=1 Tax=Enterococcus columbae DSM 7374 = ATCC 51263 TaxID=1121865 RepID=S0K626_9ENTE|nr:hypothetical protein [Enterococcus columbae]EOT39962.1 hypothetical protein OMW_01751 [Enterococcus columbae DSM 7374 = ATCC 51263]EOW83947.1 hypothetical protein I568_01394 [Enterococcus columbae DSM 7374 = ATCC 51263]OJG25834.1 hypothetical protein RR47_GL001340 [Enterococcus columbae DSM 7374 = ATCC 51263]
MFGDIIGLSLDDVELMNVEDQYVEFVQAQELPKSWTTAKKIHAKERGRLTKNGQEIEMKFRTLNYQIVRREKKN